MFFLGKNILVNNSQCIAIYQLFFDNNKINFLFWKTNFLVEFECRSTTNVMVHDQVTAQIYMPFIQNQNLFASQKPTTLIILAKFSFSSRRQKN